MSVAMQLTIQKVIDLLPLITGSTTIAVLEDSRILIIYLKYEKRNNIYNGK